MLVPDLFIILVNNPKQQLHAWNYFKSKILWKKIIKVLKKVTSSFSSHLVPFNRQSYQKQKRPGTSDQSLFTLQNKFRKISLLVMYYLTKFDHVIQSGFSVNSKNSICKFMQANLWNHKLFHFHLPFWTWKVWKRREKITKIWTSQERKELFRLNIKKEAVFLSWC